MNTEECYGGDRISADSHRNSLLSAITTFPQTRRFPQIGDLDNPDCICAILHRLQSCEVLERCAVLSSREAADKFVLQTDELAAMSGSMFPNEGIMEAAYHVMEVVEAVAEGRLDSAIAISCPRGHNENHGDREFDQYNKLTIAANFLLHKRLDLGIRKILIVELDKCYRNYRNNVFLKDPRVLYFSVQRSWSELRAPPDTEDGSHKKFGEGPGEGYNINILLKNGQCGDADYIAVWDNILIPVAREYCADMIMIQSPYFSRMSFERRNQTAAKEGGR